MENCQLVNDQYGYCIDKFSEEGSDLFKDNDGNFQIWDIFLVIIMLLDCFIMVVFLQFMDLNIIWFGEMFVVQKVDEIEIVFFEVFGCLEKNNQRIWFYFDLFWELGVFYCYIMVFVEDGDCVSVICGENGMVLQIDLFFDFIDNGG